MNHLTRRLLVPIFLLALSQIQAKGDNVDFERLAADSTIVTIIIPRAFLRSCKLKVPEIRERASFSVATHTRRYLKDLKCAALVNLAVP